MSALCLCPVEHATSTRRTTPLPDRRRPAAGRHSAAAGIYVVIAGDGVEEHDGTSMQYGREVLESWIAPISEPSSHEAPLQLTDDSIEWFCLSDEYDNLVTIVGSEERETSVAAELIGRLGPLGGRGPPCSFGGIGDRGARGAHHQAPHAPGHNGPVPRKGCPDCRETGPSPDLSDLMRVAGPRGRVIRRLRESSVPPPLNGDGTLLGGHTVADDPTVSGARWRGA